MQLSWRLRTFPLTRPLHVGCVVLHQRTVLELRLGGRVGEAAPLPGLHTESHDDLPALLPDALAILERANGSYLERLAALADEPRWAALPSSLRCGLEGAMLVSVAELERPVADAPPSSLLLDQDPDAPLDHLAGTRCVKVKVGRRDHESERRLLARVHEVLPPDAELRLDANRAFTLDDAVALADDVGFTPAYIEEPLHDPRDVDAFITRTGWPVALDESLHEPEHADLRFHDGVTAWVVKPALLGVSHTLDLFDRAPADVACVVSSSFEGPVGLDLLATLSHVAPGSPAPGLGTAAWFADTDHTTPWTEIHGR